MSHLPALIQDLALILAIAGVTTLLFKKLKQPVVLGYILAGLLVGPKERTRRLFNYVIAFFIQTQIGIYKRTLLHLKMFADTFYIRCLETRRIILTTGRTLQAIDL